MIDGKPDPDEVLRKEIKEALADPKTKPVADYFEFLNLAVIANHFVFVEIDHQGEEGRMRTPRTTKTPTAPATIRSSRKRIAGLSRKISAEQKARGGAAAARPGRLSQFGGNRAAEICYVAAGGALGRRFREHATQREPFDAKRVLATFDAYDRAFPEGRYAADIRNYRAAVALRLRDWKTALELTVAQLDDKDCAGLHGDAARRLGELFTQLTDERYRADLLPVIKASKRGPRVAREICGLRVRHEPAALHESVAARTTGGEIAARSEHCRNEARDFGDAGSWPVRFRRLRGLSFGKARRPSRPTPRADTGRPCADRSRCGSRAGAA